MTGLEALEKMYNSGRMDLHYVKCNECFNIAANELKNGEKYKKAIEIIKKKKVDVEQIIENPDMDKVIWYNTSFTGALCESWRMLTQDEFDLLKEIFS